MKNKYYFSLKHYEKLIKNFDYSETTANGHIYTGAVPLDLEDSLYLKAYPDSILVASDEDGPVKLWYKAIKT